MCSEAHLLDRWFYHRALGCLHQCTVCYTVTLPHLGGRRLLLKDQDQISKHNNDCLEYVEQHRSKQQKSFSPQTDYTVLLHHLFLFFFLQLGHLGNEQTSKCVTMCQRSTGIIPERMLA